MEWYRQYGAVYRTGGCFGVRAFVNPSAMTLTSMTARHFIRRWPKGVAAHFSFSIPIPKTRDLRRSAWRIHGTRHRYCWRYANGFCVANVLCLIEALGSVHQRQRGFSVLLLLHLSCDSFWTSSRHLPWRYGGTPASTTLAHLNTLVYRED